MPTKRKKNLLATAPPRPVYGSSISHEVFEAICAGLHVISPSGRVVLRRELVDLDRAIARQKSEKLERQRDADDRDRLIQSVATARRLRNLLASGYFGPSAQKKLTRQVLESGRRIRGLSVQRIVDNLRDTLQDFLVIADGLGEELRDKGGRPSSAVKRELVKLFKLRSPGRTAKMANAFADKINRLIEKTIP